MWTSHQALSRGTCDRTFTVHPTVGARSRPRLGTRSRSELQLRFGVQPIENLTQTREVEQQCLPSRGLGYEFGIESRPGHEGEPDRASTSLLDELHLHFEPAGAAQLHRSSRP